MATDNLMPYEQEVIDFFAKHRGSHSIDEIIDEVESISAVFTEVLDIASGVQPMNKEPKHIREAVHNLVRKKVLSKDGEKY